LFVVAVHHALLQVPHFVRPAQNDGLIVKVKQPFRRGFFVAYELSHTEMADHGRFAHFARYAVQERLVGAPKFIILKIKGVAELVHAPPDDTHGHLVRHGFAVEVPRVDAHVKG
jgi:hypothetical protein